MVDAALLDYISSLFAKLRDDPRPFGGMHAIAFGDLMQLPPVQGQKVFKASVWHLFHPIFLRDPQRQQDQKFFNILNKIRFGIVDNQVKDALTERWQAYDPREELWTTTYLSSLRDEVSALNHAVLSGMPTDEGFVSRAIDYEDNQRIQVGDHSQTFKRGTNFPSAVTCKVGAKVMFLTNSMLSDKGISNGSIGVITQLLQGGDVKAAFPTKDGIQVRCIRCNFKLQHIRLHCSFKLQAMSKFLTLIQVLELHKTSSHFSSYGSQYRRYQLPILNAFALTIHKVQGLSLPSITVALNRNIFSYGQAYVALSRAITFNKLFLSHLDFEAIKADPEAIAEYERLERIAAEFEGRDCQ
jgi:ATP-dependent DNA helicase PIF1